MGKKILVTGSAGFIGFHLVGQLVNIGYEVVGLDVLNDYYDVELKLARLRSLGFDPDGIVPLKEVESAEWPNMTFIQADIANDEFIMKFMATKLFDVVVNLAAQAGVRYSIQNPKAYAHSNLDGFLSLLEGARRNSVQNFIYASTSSVYGLNSKMPLREDVPTNHPVAFYAATKKANELMAHSYSHLFGLPTIGLRFFTVYGPWGRPDMAPMLFAKALTAGKPIKVFNHGEMLRDFTYVGDIVRSIAAVVEKPPVGDSCWDSKNPKSDSSSAPYRIFNIGNGSPTKLMDFISCLESALGVEGQHEMMDMQPGDVRATHADSSELRKYIGFGPETSIGEGVEKFVRWYKSYYLNK